MCAVRCTLKISKYIAIFAYYTIHPADRSQCVDAFEYTGYIYCFLLFYFLTAEVVLAQTRQ